MLGCMRQSWEVLSAKFRGDGLCRWKPRKHIQGDLVSAVVVGHRCFLMRLDSPASNQLLDPKIASVVPQFLGSCVAGRLPPW